MPKELFQSGTFKGLDVHDAFAIAALAQQAVQSDPGAIPWPPNLAPAPVALGTYVPGATITGPLKLKADALIILYTNEETSALLQVFTQNREWTAARKKTWCGYAHNFATLKNSIQGIGQDDGLKDGLFGYLSAVKIGSKTVVLYKTELHPKQNGKLLPFIPVIKQLVSELAPGLVISTGTAGGVGSKINCGDVAITSTARFHCRERYPAFPALDAMTANDTALSNSVSFDPQYVSYAAANLTKLSLPGLGQCYDALQKPPGYGFVKKNATAPAIYVTDKSPVPGPEPMAIVSADYLTVDDDNDSEGLQPLGIMNDTDDAFAFYAINEIVANRPKWLSVRNASEPQVITPPFPPGTTSGKIVDTLKGTAGSIYGIYQYCTTLNSAFACWGIVAGMQ